MQVWGKDLVHHGLERRRAVTQALSQYLEFIVAKWAGESRCVCIIFRYTDLEVTIVQVQRREHGSPR